MIHFRQYFAYLLLALPLLIFGCSDDDEQTSDTQRGELTMSITDAPIDDANIDKVIITINEIEVKLENGGGQVITGIDADEVDLTSLRRGNQKVVIGNVALPSGRYKEIRLKLDAVEQNQSAQANPGCYILFKDGTKQPLFIPSGSSSGLKLKGDFIVPEGGFVSLVLDFDLRKALVMAGNSGKYILKPVIRVLNAQALGLVEGTFSYDSLPSPPSHVLVYTYPSGDYVNSESANPAVGSVRFPNAETSDMVDTNGYFKLAFLLPGNYDLIFASYDANGGLIEVMGRKNGVPVTASGATTLTIVESELQ